MGMTFQAGKYSTAFRLCYFLYVAWSLLLVVTFLLRDAGQMHGSPDFQLVLSNAVFSRDQIFTAIAASFTTILLFCTNLFWGNGCFRRGMDVGGLSG